MLIVAPSSRALSTGLPHRHPAIPAFLPGTLLARRVLGTRISYRVAPGPSCRRPDPAPGPVPARVQGIRSSTGHALPGNIPGMRSARAHHNIADRATRPADARAGLPVERASFFRRKRSGGGSIAFPPETARNRFTGASYPGSRARLRRCPSSGSSVRYGFPGPRLRCRWQASGSPAAMHRLSRLFSPPPGPAPPGGEAWP